MKRSFGTGLALFGTMVAVVAFLGGRFTAQGIGPWYDGLAKPTWTPPGSTIGAVWTVLYILIAVASALVWSRPARAPGAGGYVTLLTFNLLSNVAWCFLFFTARRPGAALVEIVLLELTCLGLIVLAARTSRLAAGLLAPYAAWVAFAGYLNWTIVKLNG
jgi:benzodiazapine receptor